MNRRHLLALPALALPGLGSAQSFDRPFRLVVPFAPGGTSDILARILAPELTRLLGQNVVVENRSGAAGNLGAELVARSAPDGQTLLLIDTGVLATAPALFTRLPFDPRRKRVSSVRSNAVACKGAPEAVFAICREVPPAAHAAFEALAARGLRVLAVASGPAPSAPGTRVPDEVERGLTLLGPIALAAGHRSLCWSGGDPGRNAVSIVTTNVLDAQRPSRGPATCRRSSRPGATRSRG